MSSEVVIHADDCIDCTACVDVCPVQAIYLESNVPPEFTANTAFNADKGREIKDSGAEAISKKKDPLPSAAARKAELGY